jgi:hypothetical protein
MTRYLISFDDGAMTFPEEERDGKTYIGGFSIIDVPSRASVQHTSTRGGRPWPSQ